ncbi:DUF6332 family protein [Streptomyces sp. XD-27]|uniref:DUF6332 family protein n=1 Tax=Streptomyces sp. XD-27 TaxID=3062779 RepID=UPI0026F43EAA|nr:DUF6332 family protein [Streptomyces sp. XD-27]WKX73626.1 DUF6332 family protein [Streptomyces sp. XD-27]
MGAGIRDQAARDAVTVEIGFAVATGLLLAGALFLAAASPALAGVLDPAWEGAWLRGAGLVAGAGFAARVVGVLRRFGAKRRVTDDGRAVTGRP